MFNPFENRKQMTQGTETLGGSRAVVIMRHKETQHLALGFDNNTGSPLLVGQECYLDTDGDLTLRTTGAQFPVGVIQTPAKDGKRAVLATPFVAVVKAKNKKGSTIDAGVLVKPDGTSDADGRPGYKPILDGEIASGLTLEQIVNNGEVLVGLFRTPIQHGATPVAANGSYYVATIIKATNVSQTVDFAALEVGDIVQHNLVSNGTVTTRVIGTGGDLGQAAVVNDYYIVYRAV